MTEEPRSEWISTDKKKLKKTASPPLPERGGRGRGRSAPPGRGEGGRGGRGGGRSSSVNISAGRGRGSIAKVESTSPKPESVAKVDSTENLETNVETTPQPTKQISTPVPVAPVWGNGVSLAQKLREAASAPPRPPTPPTPPSAPQPEPEPPVESSVEEVSTSPDPVSSTFAGQSKRVSSFFCRFYFF